MATVISNVRISGVNLPVQKHTVIALTYIYGIGRSTALGMCQKSGIDPNKPLKNQSDQDIALLREAISSKTTEGDLRRQVAANIKRKIDIGSYAGLRHRRGLPLKSRTRTNARTRKGKRRG